jgi:hypothetical protein
VADDAVWWIRALSGGAAVLLFYQYYYRLLASPRIYGALREPVIARFGLARRRSLDQVSQMFNLVVTGISQLLFCALLGILLGVDPRAALVEPFPPVLILYGGLVGVAEAGLATLLSQSAIQALPQVLPNRVPRSEDLWMALLRGGWLRMYVTATRRGARSLGLSSVVLYITVEELVFRGVLLPALLPLGALPAVILAAALFVAIQSFHMPSWSSAMFPMIGAAVVGVCHGVLLLETGTIVPLVVAHLVFFAAVIG